MRAFKTSLAVLAVTLLAAGAAGAQGWHGRGGGHGGGSGGGGGRGGYAAPMGGARMGGPGPAAPRYARGGGYPVEGGYAPPRGYTPPRGYARPGMGGYPAYAPPPPAYAPGGWRRGQFLPPGMAGGQALDPRRYRLRSPPPGYAWYGVGRDAYLVQRSTGLILDTAPGAW